jgi:hypothetical protein
MASAGADDAAGFRGAHVKGVQRELVRRPAGASGSASAFTPAGLDLKLDMACYRRVRHAVLRCPYDGRYDLDRSCWPPLRKRQKITGLSLAAVIVLVELIVTMWL